MGVFLSENVKIAWFLRTQKTDFRGAPDPLRGRTEPRRARSVTGAAERATVFIERRGAD